MAVVLVIRHGETQLNHDNKVRGWSDVPLNSRGIEEALATAKLLENIDIGLIIASDLIRTKQTAQIIGAKNFVPIRITSYLRSWNSGTAMQEMDLDKAVPIMRYYVANPDQTPPGGERFGGFLRRVRLIWEHILNQARALPGQAVVVCTSSRDIDAFRFFVTGDKKYLDKDNAVTPGSVAQFDIHGASVKEVPFDPTGSHTSDGATSAKEKEHDQDSRSEDRGIAREFDPEDGGPR